MAATMEFAPGERPPLTKPLIGNSSLRGSSLHWCRRMALVAADGAAAGKTLGDGGYVAAGGTVGDWQTVPEPTSGLLMLFGCALLALRRKGK